jgi:hypothetical protein
LVDSFSAVPNTCGFGAFGGAVVAEVLAVCADNDVDRFPFVDVAEGGIGF